MYTKKYLIFLIITLNFLTIRNIILPINIKQDKIFYYYTTLYYGEEKVPQDFIIDTTSSLISSPCNLCENCGYHTNEWYNITDRENQLLNCDNNICGELSGNCENSQCSYRFDYYENAYIKGVFVNEKISFENKSSYSYDVTIGCTLNETNYIIAQDSDGIMGLNNDDNSFINRIFKKKIIPNNIFTIFINQNNIGYLSLGEIYKQYHSSENINYIPFSVDEDKYYTLKINSFEINNINIDYSVYANIDTTASLTAFPTDLFDSLVNEFNKKCTEDICGKLIKNRNFGVCAVFGGEEEMISKIKNWLEIKINFNDYVFKWKPENYWVNISTEHTARACLGFEETNEKIITLGTTFLHGYDVIFDREKNKIGFVEVNFNKEKFDYNYNNTIKNIVIENNKNENIANNKPSDSSFYNNINTNENISNNKPSGLFSYNKSENNSTNTSSSLYDNIDNNIKKSPKSNNYFNSFVIIIFILAILTIIFECIRKYRKRKNKKTMVKRLVIKNYEQRKFINK